MSRNDPKKHIIELPNSKNGERLETLGLSLVYAFYNEEEKRFNLQFDNWLQYGRELNINIVVVDDCAIPPIIDFLTCNMKDKINFNLDFYRIKEDIKWNHPGALNLGILNAPTDWVLFLDSDCFFDPKDLKILMKNLTPNPKYVYYFPRKRVYKDKIMVHRYHRCVALCHKESFKTIGGFDEDFAGGEGYGVFDVDFEIRIVSYPVWNGYWRGYIQDISVYEYMSDVVGKNIQERTNLNFDNFRFNTRLLRKKRNGLIPRNTKHLNFDWEKVASYKRKL